MVASSPSTHLVVRCPTERILCRSTLSRVRLPSSVPESPFFLHLSESFGRLKTTFVNSSCFSFVFPPASSRRWKPLTQTDALWPASSVPVMMVSTVQHGRLGSSYAVRVNSWIWMTSTGVEYASTGATARTFIVLGEGKSLQNH